MENVLEMLMVVCFGISWPLNIRKLIKSKTAKGTSVLFYFLSGSATFSALPARPSRP